MSKEQSRRNDEYDKKAMKVMDRIMGGASAKKNTDPTNSKGDPKYEV